jgi:tetratricopeptide (TPR) repeat protein
VADHNEPIEFRDSPLIANEQAANPDQDLVEADALLRKHPNHVIALMAKGVALGRLKRYAEAEEVLKKAKSLSLRKRTSESLGIASMIAFNLASFLDDMGLDQKSKQQYRESIDLGKKSNVPGGMVFAALAAYDLGVKCRGTQISGSERYFALAIDLGNLSQKPDGFFRSRGNWGTLVSGCTKNGSGRYLTCFGEAFAFARDKKATTTESIDAPE